MKQAGRGGIGTVFRDKKIAALVVKKHGISGDANHPADPERVRKAGERINKEILKPTSIKSTIQEMHLENPKGKVVIQADKESVAEMFALVYDAARDAGVEASHIALATVEN